MRKRMLGAVLALLLGCVVGARATVLGAVGGVVHDAQHRPVLGAEVTVEAAGQGAVVRTRTDAEGVFSFPALALGDYTVRVAAAGFRTMERRVSVASGSRVVEHFELQVGGAEETVTVVGESGAAAGGVTPVTRVSEEEIARTPGASRTGSLAMITDFVPGAYMTHDMLHVRGGHQVSWLLDGVQIPNTNIASNVGAQIDPKDIGYLEVQRGSYAADEGDRTFGVFNVVPRNGFNRNREGEVVVTGGNFGQASGQVNFGSHTERFAYYASVAGNRSGYGLAPPVAEVRHDAANGVGGFLSLLGNVSARDQLRGVVQVRRDFFQIPVDPDPGSVGNSGGYNSSGLRDVQRETDALADFTWVHTFGKEAVVQVSPFVHGNRADYEPGAGDSPVATTSDRRSVYAGLQASAGATVLGNALGAGVYGFGQRDGYVFGAKFADGSAGDLAPTRPGAAGGVFEAFQTDTVRVGRWVTVMGGVRESWFYGDGGERAVSPRVGVAVVTPKLGWVFRGFYGRFYQPPPLLTASGPVVDYANSQNTTFVPLHGERDEEHQFGVEIPVRGWTVDADTFKTRARNFLDHANVGESSLYYPVTVDGAVIQAWEVTVRTPATWRHGRGHLAYSNQIAKQRGALTGGLVCFPVGSDGCAGDFTYRPVDHDQRNTLSVGLDARLPYASFAAVNGTYGSGFHNGATTGPGDAYLPGVTTVDVSAGKRFGGRTTVSVNVLNVADRRVLLDNSLTFGGYHFNDPRQVYGEVRRTFGGR